MNLVFTFFRKKKTNVFLPLLLLIFMFSCAQQKEKRNNTVNPVVAVTVEKVTLDDITDTVKIFGEIKLRNEMFISSQFDGRLTGFSKIEGDYVKKGEKLGVIVPPMREALMQSAGKLTNDQKRLIAEEVKEIPLFSPGNGIVLKVNRHNGDVISKGESILHVADLKTLDIYGDLPVEYLPYINVGDTVTVRFIGFPHKKIFLPVSSVGGEVNKKSQTVKLRLSFNNENEIFRPGLRVVLSFASGVHKNVVVIPKSALLEEEGVLSVFVAEGNRVLKRTVKTGIRSDERIEILSGIKPGEKIITENAYSLTDGMEVEIK